MIEYHTFGCKVNTYDTGLLQQNILKDLKDLSPLSHADRGSQPVHILNTCAVTAEATKDALRVVRKLKKSDPNCLVVVTGCGAQVDTKLYEEEKGVDLVVANTHKEELPLILKNFQHNLRSGGQKLNDEFSNEFSNESNDESSRSSNRVFSRVYKTGIFKNATLGLGGGTEKSHTRTFLKIQDGCNSFCSYCIIPFARGLSRSVTIEHLVGRVNELYDQGVREVVFTGIHIADYADGEKQIEDLVEAMLVRTLMPRMRLTSLEPGEVSDSLLRLFENPRMCPHFHMSIQSACTEVLHGMKRRYDQSQVQESLRKIDRVLPGVFIGMDVIVGFPNETSERFEETMSVLRDLPWTRIHVFPYSERPGTKAATMTETVPWQERVARAEKMRALSLNRYLAKAQAQIGTIKKVLLLNKSSKGGSDGLSRDYWPVGLSADFTGNFTGDFKKPWDEKLRGSEVEVEISNHDGDFATKKEGILLGRIV